MSLRKQIGEIAHTAKLTEDALRSVAAERVSLRSLAETIVECRDLLNQITELLVGEEPLPSSSPMSNVGELDIVALEVTLAKIETANARLRGLIVRALDQQPLPPGCWEECFDAIHKLVTLLPKRCATVDVNPNARQQLADELSHIGFKKFAANPVVDLTAAPGYEQLVQVFSAAHDQAAYGKGKERHANGLPFHEQRMQGISDLVGSPDGMVYQLVKKTTEGLQFDSPEKREHELLGALNYLAGIVIWLRRHEAAKPAEG